MPFNWLPGERLVELYTGSINLSGDSRATKTWIFRFRKVASISGDCRRALDICRRATEIAESDCSGKRVMVSMLHVQKAFNEMITNPKVLAIKGCSKYEKFFLQAVEAEVGCFGKIDTIYRTNRKNSLYRLGRTNGGR